MFIPERPLDSYSPVIPAFPALLRPTKYDNFAPRIGLAYSPNVQKGLLAKILGGPGKTSIRAGYGLFYTAFEGLSAGIMSANPPYGYDYTSLAPPLFATPFVTAASGQNVGQRFPLSFPAFGASARSPIRMLTGRNICRSPASRPFSSGMCRLTPRATHCRSNGK